VTNLHTAYKREKTPRLLNDLLRVQQDVKLYSLTRLLAALTIHISKKQKVAP